jgi:hypothetical protein
MHDTLTVQTEHDLYCPHCAYNLRSVPSIQCPECGHEVNRTLLAQTHLPWTQRKRLGLFRAYWRTVWMAVFRSRNMLAEMEGDVTLTAARPFWIISVLHAWTPFVVATVALGFIRPIVGRGRIPVLLTESMFIGIVTSVWPVAIVALGMLAWLTASTGAASYFCHPCRLSIERQNRAIALSYYACAVLAFLAPGALLTAAGMWIGIRFDSQALTVVSACFGALIVAWVGVEGYVRTVRLVKSTTSRSVASAIGIGIALPLIWAALFVLLGLGLPAMLIYAVLFVMSRMS